MFSLTLLQISYVGICRAGPISIKRTFCETRVLGYYTNKMIIDQWRLSPGMWQRAPVDRYEIWRTDRHNCRIINRYFESQSTSYMYKKIGIGNRDYLHFGFAGRLICVLDTFNVKYEVIGNIIANASDLTIDYWLPGLYTILFCMQTSLLIYQ